MREDVKLCVKAANGIYGMERRTYGTLPARAPRFRTGPDVRAAGSISIRSSKEAMAN